MLHNFVKLQKVAGHYYQQRLVGFPTPGPLPHMPPEAIDFFTEQLIKSRKYVEFGSGGSTVLASTLSIATTSVESDAYYAKAVAAQLIGDSVKQIIASLGPSMAWGMPAFPRAKLARRYVMAPWGEHEFADFILVDGRYRVACALASAKQTYDLGLSAVLMFDDYLDREVYHAVEEFLGQPIFVSRAAVFQIGSQLVPAAAIEHWLRDPI